VAVYGVLERLGIDKDVWQQDVQSRVFSTLGQPNWLAAWLITLIPIAWAKGLNNKDLKINFSYITPYFFSSLFFTVLLFTGSRSGILGFCLTEIVFWGIIFIKSRVRYIKEFLIFNLLILSIAGIFGTQYTPSIFKIIENKNTAQVTTPPQATGTALETGGTESGVIRKIVWQGAIDIWKKYPIFGTGVETFAYSYYSFRPIAHNLTTEWDFIYNKAHNEYLNFMANTGTVGILAYLAIIGFSIYLIAKNSFHKNSDDSDYETSTLSIAFIAGYVSILVTNFFGFSVVPVQLIFYLFPALSVVLTDADSKDEQKLNPSSNQKILYWMVLLGASVIVFFIGRYWYADYLYATGTNYNRVNRQDLAINYLFDAAKLEPNQSVYYGELSKTYTNLALAYNEAKQATASSQLTEAAIENSIKAVNLSPANVNMKRVEFGVFVMLSAIDQNYLLNARDVLLVAIKQAPTDAKLFYNLGLIYSRIGEDDLALQTLKKTIDLKSNYKDSRLAYAILLIDAGRKSEAKEELEYILNFIDPTDSLSKQYLESLK
jgi:Tfp pilus assembly protein PilF